MAQARPRLQLWGVSTSRTLRALWALHELALDYTARPIQPPRVIEASIVLPVWRGPLGRRPATMRREALPECNWCRGFRKQPFGLACHRPLEIGRADASTCP